MSVSVVMPQLGESVTEGTVTRWLKKEGERVTADEPLLEVSTDKVDTEIPSPATGILRGIAVDEDETVAVGADGPANLYEGVSVAIDPKAAKRGVLVVMNDEIHSARDVEKMNTISLNTFASPERGPVGRVVYGRIAWGEGSPDKKHTTRSEFAVDKLETLPRVDIIYAHANMSPDLIDAAAKSGAKGIVIAGVGDGNMTQEAAAVLERLAKKGVLVIRASRLATGPVLRNSEVDDDKAGFVASGELSPPKARVLAQLALAKGAGDPRKVQDMFYTY